MWPPGPATAGRSRHFIVSNNAQEDSRQSTGIYSGRGPKGYQRSDDRIKEEVCECLARDPNVDASDIEVDVIKGEVTLTGTVIERRQKRCAEDAIEHVSGVKDVHNRIRVESYRIHEKLDGLEDQI
jgi:osmotically-inducible protein OsmY